jgi:nanoRNase/pAp phosphatase (c-di-AMP/oligoRNAs hydrolase)
MDNTITENDAKNNNMVQPFPKSMTASEKVKRLGEMVGFDDALAILIDADPDAIAGALALSRIFWRKARHVAIFHINTIQRADNRAFVQLLRIEMKHLRHLKPKMFTKWAILDSQPHHHEQFMDQPFDIIIDHHPAGPSSQAPFLEIKEKYGATSTIMTEYLRAAKIKPSPRLATALFYGIKTDTDNFVRETLSNDVNAFRYLYQFTNMNIIKKIESSELTKDTLSGYRLAMDKLKITRDIAFVFMGPVKNPDLLVIIADFFIRMAEITWSIVTGVCGGKVIAIIRNAGFRRDAGKMAQKIFGQWSDYVGGHKSAARAEIQLEDMTKELGKDVDLEQLLFRNIKGIR